jgi:hypothetical protein
MALKMEEDATVRKLFGTCPNMVWLWIISVHKGEFS